jgi:hypothetical protein
MEQANAVEPERVEQRHYVGKQLVARVAPASATCMRSPGSSTKG